MLHVSQLGWQSNVSEGSILTMTNTEDSLQNKLFYFMFFAHLHALSSHSLSLPELQCTLLLRHNKQLE